MGIFLTNKTKNVSIGYIGFAIIRREIANAYDDKIGTLYDKIYNPLFKGYSEDENKYLDEYLPKYLDKFLYHSDCDGHFCMRDVKGIYNELIKIKPTFAREDLYKKYNDLLELFSQGKGIDIY